MPKQVFAHMPVTLGSASSDNSENLFSNWGRRGFDIFFGSKFSTSQEIQSNIHFIFQNSKSAQKFPPQDNTFWKKCIDKREGEKEAGTGRAVPGSAGLAKPAIFDYTNLYPNQLF